jgi:hypothetical protein
MSFKRLLNRFRISQTVIIGAVVAFTTGAVHGQSQALPTPQDRVPVLGDVEKRLQSGVARDIAWGAFLAAQYRLVGAVSLIATALQTPVPEQIEKHSMISALLDALIQLDAHLPARELVPMCGWFGCNTPCVVQRPGFAGTSTGGPTDTERVDCLKALLEPNARSAVQLKATDWGSVAWHGAEDLQQQVSRRRDDINRDYQRLLSSLVQALRLTWSEASMMRPIIDVQLIDPLPHQT